MNGPWRVAAGLLFILLLAGGLVWAAIDDGGGDDRRSPDIDPEQPPATSEAERSARATSSIAPGTMSPTVPSVAIRAPETLPPVVVTVAPPSIEVTLEDVLPAVEAALTAWGEFAVTGDLELVAEVFDVAGPQYAQLRQEAAALAADPIGPPPYVFTLTDPSLRRPDPDRAVVVADVALERPGEATQVFRWRIVMRWVGGDWLLWTVRDEGE